MSRKKLTDGEKAVLGYVIQYKNCNGISPSRKEIMAGINTKSRQYIDEALEKLEDKGYIEFYRGCNRSICVKKFSF